MPEQKHFFESILTRTRFLLPGAALHVADGQGHRVLDGLPGHVAKDGHQHGQPEAEHARMKEYVFVI